MQKAKGAFQRNRARNVRDGNERVGVQEPQSVEEVQRAFGQDSTRPG
jgi:hypothetical protein